VRRFLRWLFGSPVEELPPEFGDPRPPELRVFEKELEAREALQEHTEPAPPVEQESTPERPPGGEPPP